MTTSRRVSRGLLALSLIILVAVPAYGQRGMQGQGNQQAAFFDNIHAPNWLGTDIAHTPIKSQIGGTCWNFATVSFLESEVYRTNPELIQHLRENRMSLDLSEYYVVYWAWVEKAREFVKRKGEGLTSERRGELRPTLGDGGLSHDTVEFIRKYGIVPESEYTEPENSRQMSSELAAVMMDAYEKGEWNERQVIQAIREVLDRNLAPPPETFEWEGETYTPRQWADEYLKLDYDNYWEITSYTDFPFYTRGELDIRDNWWDCDGYYNVPLDAYIRIMNGALDNGFSVAVDTDWMDAGAQWNQAGIAVMHPDVLSPYLINQESRQTDFMERRTTDDHLVHAIDHRVVDGHDWYLIKNSHGTSSGRRGYVWMRGDYFAMRVLAIMVHRDAVERGIVQRFYPPNN